MNGSTVLTGFLLLADGLSNQVFVPLSKNLPNRLPTVEYCENYLVRSVRSEGAIRWKGHLIYLSGDLAKERIGLELIDDDRWQL